MIDPGNNPSPIFYSRVAGISYLLTISLGIFSANIVGSTLIVPGDDASTLQNILENELLFRIGIASEIFMYMLVILLGFSLFIVVKTVNINLALLALFWRLAEAIVGASTVIISGLIPLLLLQEDRLIETTKLHGLLGLFLDVRGAGLDIVLIFIGMGGTIFCYLFYISSYVPKILAAWGILTYLSMLILAMAGILSPNITEATKMMFYAPGGLFEITFGLWLLIKGVKTDHSQAL